MDALAVVIGFKQRTMKKLINWKELSRELTGNQENIRSNKCPKKYQEKVYRLLNDLEAWIKWTKE